MKVIAVPPRVLVASRDSDFYAEVLVQAMCLMAKAVASTAWDDELMADLAFGAPKLTKQKKRARLDMVEFLDRQKTKRKAVGRAADRAAKRQAVTGRPTSLHQPTGM